MQHGDSDVPEGAAPARGRELLGRPAGPAQPCSPRATGSRGAPVTPGWSHVHVPVTHHVGQSWEGARCGQWGSVFLGMSLSGLVYWLTFWRNTG